MNNEGALVDLCTQDYKCLCTRVMICTTSHPKIFIFAFQPLWTWKVGQTGVESVSCSKHIRCKCGASFSDRRSCTPHRVSSQLCSPPLGNSIETNSSMDFSVLCIHKLNTQANTLNKASALCTLTTASECFESTKMGLSDWVGRVWRPTRHAIGYLGDKSFKAINCTGTDNQTTQRGNILNTKWLVLTQINWAW